VIVKRVVLERTYGNLDGGGIACRASRQQDCPRLVDNYESVRCQSTKDVHTEDVSALVIVIMKVVYAAKMDTSMK
jgi:hypothetical protein